MSDHSYEFGSTIKLIEHDLSMPVAFCKCDCHTLWGLEGSHTESCCDLMLEGNVQ